MTRPIGPKKLAAIEQRDALRAKGIPDDEIKQSLILSGLTKVQANEIMPADEVKPAPSPISKTTEAREAVLEGAVHFLEGIAKRITPGMADRFSELGSVKSDSLSWARKMKNEI